MEPKSKHLKALLIFNLHCPRKNLATKSTIYLGKSAFLFLHSDFIILLLLIILLVFISIDGVGLELNRLWTEYTLIGSGDHLQVNSTTHSCFTISIVVISIFCMTENVVYH